MKRNSVVIASLIITILVLASIPYVNKISHQDAWKKRTSPLPAETRKLLCNNFGLSPGDPLCSSKKDIYGLDFMTVVQDTFRPYEAYGTESSEAATYTEVEKKIGMFKYECEPVVHQADGFTYFVCYYDLRGDREFIMGILYTYPEMAVMRITSTSKLDE